MRIARFVTPDGREMTGEVVGEVGAWRGRPLTGELFGELRFAAETVPIARFRAPLDPVNIFAIGRNYAAHAAETGSQVPERPLVFMKPTTAVIADEETIELPAAAPNEVDYEAELALVIGGTARCVAERDALAYVFGYTCANDVSARDCQKKDKQWARAKGFDTFCPLGPWIVTRDAFDPSAVAVRSRLNGQLMQNGNTQAMLHSCAQLVSYLSHQFTLRPGTLILTGTPEGVGMAREPAVYLRAGDEIAVEIEGLGTLRNRVAAARM